MYLTKLNMDLRNRSIQQGLRDCTDMHRNIQKIFNSNRTDAQLLYRLVSRGNSFAVYLMSAEEVREEMIDSDSGFSLAGSKCLDDFEKRIETGNTYRFDLVAFPSKKIPNEKSRNSKRVFLSNETEQIEWLYRKAEAGGFIINSVSADRYDSITTNKKDHRITLNQIHFYGSLTITDRSVFLNCWKGGIGPEKAYGMGMLMVR